MGHCVGSCSIRTLGPLEVLVAGKPAALGGQKQRVVLAMLALRTPSVVSTDELIEAVWSHDLPPRPSSVLKVYVANLRRLLEPGRAAGVASGRLVGDARGYCLRVGAGELDVIDFASLVTQAHAAVADGDLVEGRQQLELGLSLWRGSPFPDLVDVPSAKPEIAALEERRLTALEEAMQIGLALGRHTDVVVELERVIGEHPYRERLRTMHAVALYRCQRQTDALVAVRDACRVLGEELGLEPGPELRTLEVAILRHDPSLLGSTSERTGQRTRRRVDNLPAAPTSLIGRQADIDAVRGLVVEHDARLVTLCGPGGTGKTRLAVAVAEQLAETMADGACFVDLAPLDDEQQIVSAVAGALGVTARGPGELESAVHSFLRPRQLVMVLDNFEHLLSAWPVPARLLAAAPRLRVLITSRSPLGISGEQRYDVPPLAVPRLSPLPPRDRLARIPAVELFTLVLGWSTIDSG